MSTSDFPLANIQTSTQTYFISYNILVSRQGNFRITGCTSSFRFPSDILRLNCPCLLHIRPQQSEENFDISGWLALLLSIFQGPATFVSSINHRFKAKKFRFLGWATTLTHLPDIFGTSYRCFNHTQWFGEQKQNSIFTVSDPPNPPPRHFWYQLPLFWPHTMIWRRKKKFRFLGWVTPSPKQCRGVTPLPPRQFRVQRSLF
jgi:hypothetical protein